VLLAGCGGFGLLDDGGGGPPGPVPIPPDPSAQEVRFAFDVLDLVNEERTSRGLPALAWDEGAATAAYGHAYDMEVREFFDHVNPNGESPVERLERAGVVFGTLGENIAVGQPTPASVMAGWMSSAGHRENVLDPAFTRLGVGVRLGSGPYWVQDFVGP
jgi:uncharacterized protein YkwD